MKLDEKQKATIERGSLSRLWQSPIARLFHRPPLYNYKWVELAWNTMRFRVIEVLREVSANQGLILNLASGAYSNVGCDGLIIHLDINHAALKELCASNPNAYVVEGDGFLLPFKDSVFDLVLINQWLHHLSYNEIGQVFTEVRRVSEGIVVINEPNLFYLLSIFTLLVQKILPGITGLLPYEKPLNPRKVINCLHRNGFKICRVESLSYGHPRMPSFLQRWLFQITHRIRSNPLFKYLGWHLIYVAEA